MCTGTGHSVRDMVKCVRKQASPCSPWENPGDRHPRTHAAKRPIAQPCSMILMGFHVVGTMKGLTAEPSHQQGSPLLQITARRKSRRLHEVLALRHSHPLLTATVAGLGTWGNKTAQQVSNHTLLSPAMQVEAAVPAVHSILSDQHLVWQMLTLKCLKNHCNRCSPNTRPQSAQILKLLLFFPRNSQLSAFT